MKGGRTPIHIQRWAPADYHEDEHVRLLKTRRDYRTLTFYRHFIDRSFSAGGDLPADLEALAAVVEMPRRDVERALSFCLGRLIERRGGRLYQKRVEREVRAELAYRTEQAELGRKGGLIAGRGRGKNLTGQALIDDRGSPSISIGPPAPYAGAVRRAPAPAPDTGTDGACGNVENSPAPPDPDTPAPPSRSLETTKRPAVTAETARAIDELAEELARECPEVDAAAWILRASKIEADARGPTRFFRRPREPGVTEAWARTTLRKLEGFLADQRRPPPL